MRHIDCLILSTGRAASTSIYHYLDQRAELCLPQNKEPHTLIDVTKYPKRSHLLDKIYVPDVEHYAALYDGSKLMIDASVGYFFYIEELIATLKKLHQTPKVVFLYREPVSRAASLFNELRKKGFEQSATLDQALSTEKASGLWWENYYDNVPYSDHFMMLKSYFRDVLPVSYAAVAADPGGVVGRILGFLGVEATAEIAYIKHNSSASAKTTILSKKWPMLRRLLPRALKRGVAAIYTALNGGSQAGVQEPERYLGYSMEQYRLFKEYLNRE